MSLDLRIALINIAGSQMADQCYVQIVDFQTDEIVKQMGPMTKWKADKVDRGVNINLNHDAYYTQLVDESDVDGK